ncbi:MAG: lysylphosphatidylglycerol synthase transmembrane domain-containing protein [Bryobacteraceae bacterium]
MDYRQMTLGPSAVSEQPPTRLSPHAGLVPRAGIALVSLVAAGLGLRYALSGLDWPSFWSGLRHLEPRWLAAAVAFDVASYVAQGFRWSLLLSSLRPGGWPGMLWRTTRAIYAGLFVNEVVPLRPGEVARAWLAARDLRVGVWAVAPAMLTERLFDGLWLTIALLAAIVAVPVPASVARTVWTLAAAVFALIAMVFALCRMRSSAFFLPFLLKLATGLRDWRACAVSACFLVAQGLAFWSVMRASHLPLGMAAAFVVMVIVRIGTMIPGPPANAGIHQFATVLGLSLYGVSRANAAAFSLVVFAVLTMPLLIIGLAAWISTGLTWRFIRDGVVLRG